MLIDTYRTFETATVRFDEARDGVLRLTLQDPDRWNAIPVEVHDRLPELFAKVSDDRGVRAFMLTGAGTVFSSGADLDDLPERSIGDLVQLREIAVRIITRLLEIRQPTLCLVNGPAVGFAASLALNFDFILATPTATFSDPHAAFGVAPGDGLVLAAMATLGPVLTREFLYGGRTLTAEEAAAHGLVNYVCAHDDLHARSFELIDRLLAMAPLAIELGKRMVNSPLRAHAEQILFGAMSAEALTLASHDYEVALREFRATRRFANRWQGT